MTQPPNNPGDYPGGEYPSHDPGDGSYPQQPGGYPGYPPPQGQGFPPAGDQGYPPPGGQSFPPPGAGYPPQGGQGFPPPPQGGYGQPYGAPGYGGPGYGAPEYGGPGYGAPGYGGPGFGGRGNIGDGFSWAWNKFTKNAAALIVPLLVYAVLLLVLSSIFSLLFSDSLARVMPSYGLSADTSNVGEKVTAGDYLGVFLGGVVQVVIASIVQSAYLNGVFHIADGRPVGIGDFFKPRNLGQVVVAGLIFGVLSILFAFIPYVGLLLALVLGFFSWYTIFVIVDRNVSAIDGIKQAFDVVKANPGLTILAYVIAVLLTFVGVLLCLVGSLVTVPIAALLIAYAYRSSSNSYLAPLTP